MIWIFVAITIAATHYIAFKWGAIVTLQRCKADIARMYDERSADNMSTGKWRDETSYAHGERGNVEPRVWQLDGCDFRVTVHRLHRCPGWFLSVPDLRIDRRDLGTESLEVAKGRALEIVRGTLVAMTASIDAAEMRS